MNYLLLQKNLKSKKCFSSSVAISSRQELRQLVARSIAVGDAVRDAIVSSCQLFLRIRKCFKQQRVIAYEFYNKVASAAFFYELLAAGLLLLLCII